MASIWPPTWPSAGSVWEEVATPLTRRPGDTSMFRSVGETHGEQQEPLSIAALLMASFPRFPMGLVDNRCHLQAGKSQREMSHEIPCLKSLENP